jgi:hypothetical protein
LLITITLLAFLVLLLVSLAALTRVETQVASNNQELAQARQNALMALNIALGQLQQTAGPDQRTTAPSVFGETITAVTARDVASNGLVTPVNGARYWTGVWGNKASPESIFTSAPAPVLLRWLVSGNENTTAPTITAAGQIATPAAAATMTFNPAQPITQQDGSALTATTGATSGLTINARPAALLLGAKTAGTNVNAYVAAPLVEITSTQVAGLSGTSRIGRYAWWVGDEGVKTKFNLPDPFITANTPDSAATATSRDSRYRLLAAQRNGIERLAAFNNANYPLAATAPTDPLYTGVRNTLTPSAIRIASPGASAALLPNHVHDLTTYSRGVLANSQFGGLRRDLTFHLDPRSGDTFLDGRNILPDGPTPVSSPSAYPGSKYNAHPSLFSETTANGGLGFTTLNVSPRLGPKWDQLKSYYKIAYDQLTYPTPGTLEVQPAVDLDTNPAKATVQAGISPVILETRFMFALNAGPSIDTTLILILGNPYSRPLTAKDGLNFRAVLHRNNYTNTRQDSREWGIICNYIGPVLPGFEGQDASTSNTENHHLITSAFTRYIAGDSNPNATMQQHPLHHVGNPNRIYHPHYYPILKFAPNPPGDGLQDPDPNDPGVLENVFFQIPPGLLNIAPGEARAYKLDIGTSLPNETVDGVPFRVVALQEMTDTFSLDYFNHPCSSRYLNSASAYSPGGAMEPGSEFRMGLTMAAAGGMDFILSIPRKPLSVLQSVGPYDMPGTPTQNSGVPKNEFTNNVFSAPRTVVGAGRSYRLFRAPTSSQSVMAPHGETSLLGSIQMTKLFDLPAGSAARTLVWGSVGSLDSTTFVNNLDPSTATQSAWGPGDVSRVTRTTNGKFLLNDAPAAALADDIPFLSLAHLQHLDLTADDEALGTATQPAYAVGNSRYNRLVPRSASRTGPQANNRSLYWSNQSNTSATALGDSPHWYSGLVPDLPKQTPIRRYDISYLLNTALWDDVFFSTVRPSAGSDATASPLPANRRLEFATDEAPTLGQLRGADVSAAIPQPASLAPGESGRVPAAQILINGAFNVNSTSTQAWIALLSGLRGLALNSASAVADRTPVARSIRQTGGVINDTANYTANDASIFTGFRSLTDTQIATLAGEIVKQVKARGPFLSLSQFINRNLTPAAAPADPVADTGLAGALQQAIDRAGLNAFINNGSDIPPDSGINVLNSYPDNAFMPTNNTAPNNVSGIGSYMGAPGWLNQGDLLQSLAPILSSRSDTFVIRTYGEVLDSVNSPASGTPVVKGRAWCEAVVQRLPDYVDSTERPTLHPSLANTQNQNFGRRFRIVSFRWLSPDDI